MSELKNVIFNEKQNLPVVHEAIRWYLASARRGTHSAKTRTEVSGGGHKPWKQKGTGRARSGSNRSPLWRKGGVIFPPKMRSYAYNLPIKMRKLALRVALSEFNRDDKIKVVEKFALPKPKTSEGKKYFAGLGVSGKVLFILAESQPEFERGIRNLAGVEIAQAQAVNIYDLLKCEWLVVDQAAVKMLEERL